MFPVVFPPRVRVLFLTVWRDPAPVKYVALLEAFALIEAVRVPELTLMNANLEEEVAVDPKRRSRVEANFGNIAPAVIFQLVPPLPTQEPQEGDPAHWEMKHSPTLPAVV